MQCQNHGNRVISNFPSTLCCAVFADISVCALCVYIAGFSVFPASRGLFEIFLELCGATSKLSAQSGGIPFLFASLCLFWPSLLSPGTCPGIDSVSKVSPYSVKLVLDLLYLVSLLSPLFQGIKQHFMFKGTDRQGET